MHYPNDRRLNERRPEDGLTPEFLAVLRLCGGKVREGDVAEPAPTPGERRHVAAGAGSYEVEPGRGSGR